MKRAQDTARHELRLLYYKSLYRKKILETRPHICQKKSRIEIHVLTCQRDFLDAIWALKTFYYFSQLDCSLVIHSDGSLSDQAKKILSKHFKHARIIDKRQADTKLRPYLDAYPYCSKVRFSGLNPYVITIFDYFVFAEADYIINLDSDVLFFQQPKLLQDFVRNRKPFFSPDYQDAFSLPRLYMNKLLNLEIPAKFCNGIMMLPTQILNLEILERFLEENDLGDNWTDQTGMAILFAASGLHYERLPAEYQISGQPLTATTVSHHFVSDGSRDRFYSDGLRYLEKEICILEKLNSGGHYGTE